MKPGVYRIYKLRFDENNQAQRKMAGRVWIEGGQIRHLEDHKRRLSDLLPEGPVTPELERRFAALQHNPYMEVIDEADLAAGHHPHELQQLDVGETAPEQKFVMTGDGLTHPSILEMWHDAVVLDGRRLDDTEAHQLLSEVAAGRIVLTPV